MVKFTYFHHCALLGQQKRKENFINHSPVMRNSSTCLKIFMHFISLAKICQFYFPNGSKFEQIFNEFSTVEVCDLNRNNSWATEGTFVCACVRRTMRGVRELRDFNQTQN